MYELVDKFVHAKQSGVCAHLANPAEALLATIAAVRQVQFRVAQHVCTVRFAAVADCHELRREQLGRGRRKTTSLNASGRTRERETVAASAAESVRGTSCAERRCGRCEDNVARDNRARWEA
jgi:hypothetical protein